MLTILTYCSIGIAATAVKGLVGLYIHSEGLFERNMSFERLREKRRE